MEKIYKKVIIFLILILLLTTTVTPIVIANNRLVSGYVRRLRGGFGANALIDSYYAGGCFENVPVNYYLTIEGPGVINPGTNSGVAPGMSYTWARTTLAFGFGPVTLICIISRYGRILEERTKFGLMIGFFVLAI